MLKWLFFVVAAIFFFTVYFHNVIEFDQDLGRHLLTGQIIWQTHQIPKINLFSYTQTSYPFINSHWLSEVIFYLIATWQGIISLVYLKAILMVGTLSLVLYTSYKFSKNLLAAAVALIVFSPVLLERTEIRPEIFSYLFVAIFMFVILVKPKLLWLLPILEIIWVNSHIYFILGPILVLIFFLQKFWESHQTTRNFRSTILITKNYWLITLLVLLATLINPDGLAGAIYPFFVMNNYGYSIVENQNFFFLRTVVFNPNIFYFEVATAALLISFFLSVRRLPTIAYLLLPLTILPVLHIRSFPLLFLIELPVFAFSLARIVERDSSLRRTVLLKNSSFIVVAVIILSLLRSYRLASNQYYLAIDSHKRFGSEISESGKGAVDFILANNLRGPIFNNFDIGSYLDYRLYPAGKVFVDGRPEAYPVTFFQNLYIPMQQTPENFAKVDDIYKFNLIIYSHTDATPWAQTFLASISQNKNFSLVYLDGYAVIFVRKDSLPTIPVKIISPKNSLDWLNLGQVEAIFGNLADAQKSFEKALTLNPDSSQALQALGQIYSQKQETYSLGQQYLTKYREKSGLILF